MNEKPKLCPLLYLGIIMAQGRSEDTPREDFECMAELCAVWNETDEKCGLIKA